MPAVRDQFRSSYGTFAARERELERSRARRDAREAAQDAAMPEAAPVAATSRPSR